MEPLDEISDTQQGRVCLEGSEFMILEGVWEVLRDEQWESERQLREASGVDDLKLRRIICFLERWDFAEIRMAPDLQVRCKPGVVSPVAVIRMLRSMIYESSLPGWLRLAERVACRACGERKFNFLGGNQVECTRCHDQQWYAIEVNLENEGYREEPARLNFEV